MYRDVPFSHNLDGGGAPPDKSNIAAAGCGICVACMVVENLTLANFSIEECIETAYQAGATRKPGTEMSKLGPAVAERFGLTYSGTCDVEELKAHLAAGGMAVANSGGDREGYTGVFTHGGHYVLVVSGNADEACILDPSMREGKYDEPERIGKVRVHRGFAYCSWNVLAEDCSNRSPSFHLFARSSDA